MPNKLYVHTVWTCVCILYMLYMFSISAPWCLEETSSKCSKDLEILEDCVRENIACLHKKVYIYIYIYIYRHI